MLAAATLAITDLANIGGSRGCVWCTPPMGPNSFIFAYIFTKKCPCQRSTTPLMGAHPPMGNPGSATGWYCNFPTA